MFDGEAPTDSAALGDAVAAAVAVPDGVADGSDAAADAELDELCVRVAVGVCDAESEGVAVPEPVRVAGSVCVADTVGVNDAELVGVAGGVPVAEPVRVRVLDGDAPGDSDADGGAGAAPEPVADTVGVCEGVHGGVAAGVRVAVRECVGVSVCVAVPVTVAAAVRVGVGALEKLGRRHLSRQSSAPTQPPRRSHSASILQPLQPPSGRHGPRHWYRQSSLLEHWPLPRQEASSAMPRHAPPAKAQADSDRSDSPTAASACCWSREPPRREDAHAARSKSTAAWAATGAIARV